MPTPKTAADILAAAPSSAWQAIPPEDLLVMTVGDQDVLIELAPAFAPKNVANIRTLVSVGYFDGLAIVRSQDNYVVQWADPDDETEQARPLGKAKAKVKAEFDRPARQLEPTLLDAQDAYADQVGFVDGFPVGTDTGAPVATKEPRPWRGSQAPGRAGWRPDPRLIPGSTGRGWMESTCGCTRRAGSCEGRPSKPTPNGVPNARVARRAVRRRLRDHRVAGPSAHAGAASRPPPRGDGRAREPREGRERSADRQ